MNYIHYIWNGTAWVEHYPVPAPHTHTIPDITGLNAALNSKQDILNIPQYSLPYRTTSGSGTPNTHIEVSLLAAGDTVVARYTDARVKVGTPTENDDAVTKLYADTLPGTWKQVKSRADTGALTAVSTNTAVITGGIDRYHVYKMEISNSSSYLTNPKIIEFTLAASSNSSGNNISFTEWDGTTEKITTIAPYYTSTSGGTMMIGTIRQVTRTVSGTTMTFTTSTPGTIYIGRVWRLQR